MKKILRSSSLFFLFPAIFFSCNQGQQDASPYFGNGIRNGWADQNSIVIWTRLTSTPGLNRTGPGFLLPGDTELAELRKSTDKQSIINAQIPEGYSLDQMEGACPGKTGEVMLIYFPSSDTSKKIETPWEFVDSSKNFTKQWKLQNLQPGTKYILTLKARQDAGSGISDSISGSFITPPSPGVSKSLKFCIVTCHDYPRRDDSINGHKIYKAMLGMNPDFFVHTGDVEYYDKPYPYALTEELMYFKWNRFFALPYQREFYKQHTSYFMKDDHDVLSDDAYPGMTYGTVSFERGLEIFDKEQFPSNDKPYKTIRWGKDLQIWIMEGRNYRSQNNIPDGPGKTIWGKEQKDWLFRTLQESDATYKLVITPTPILGPDRSKKNDNHSNVGFQSEGDEIRSFLNRFDNVYICNGDRHWQYVTHPKRSNLWEFSCGAGSDSHAAGWPPDEIRPEHRFLRVKGGFLMGSVFYSDGKPCLRFEHFDVDGNPLHEENFTK